MRQASLTVPTKSTELSTGRGMLAYLLLPRPGDVSKWAIIPATFLIGALTLGSSAAEVGKAALVWFAVEYLVYQARYQWNDIRGFTADQLHPDCAARGRLPGPVGRARRNIAVSRWVASGRLALACGIPLLLPALGLGPCVYGATAGVLLVAAIYELTRSAGTGKVAVTEMSSPRPAVIGLWVVSGAGYAVRGVTGLALSINLTRHVELAVAASIALWSGGIAFVTGRWAIESLAFAEVSEGKLRWRATADQAREHLVVLGRWMPTQAKPDSTAHSLQAWRALRPRGRISAPWNCAFLLSAASAALTGVALGETSVNHATSWHAAAVIVGLISALVLLNRPSWLVVLTLSIVLAAAAVQAGLAKPWLVLAPLAITLSIHVMSRRQRLAGIGGVGNAARTLLRAGGSALQTAASKKLARQAPTGSASNAGADLKQQARV